MGKKRRGASDVGVRIRYWREKAGLNKVELAEIVGVDSSAVSHWEAGRTPPTLANLAKVADATGIDLRMFWAPVDLSGTSP